MAVLQDINNLILLSDGYLLELQSDRLSEQVKGCSGCGYLATMQRIVMLKGQLLYQIEIEDLGERTDSLYTCLLSAVQDYSGASITLDPNASIPNTVITIPTITIPQWFDALWSEFEDVDDPNGYRYTYTNSILDGWNPDTKLVNALTGQELRLGVHYDMYEGGVFMLRPDYGLDSSNYIRFDNFHTYNAPPLPVPIIPNAPTNGVVDNEAHTFTFIGGQE